MIAQCNSADPSSLAALGLREDHPRGARYRGAREPSRIHRHVQHRQSEPSLRKVAITLARSTGKAFLTNFSTYDAPFLTRTRLALANNWRKLSSRSGCCGNYGQPGC